ncbi:MAG: DsrE/DsrF/DrsH-like family protein [Thiotrichales bacterium]|nr:DsrE/DsrF/DrsH-like family protein [Thiotrichales bacterium]
MSGRLSIIHSKGSLDWAYPTFILASTAAAMDQEVELFFTMYGLECVRHHTEHLRVSPLSNPAMPVRFPIGPAGFQKVDWRPWLPNLVLSLPGMERLATWGFKRTLQQQGQLPFDELRALCLELGVRFTVCQMSVDLMGLTEKDFIEGVQFAGAASYLAASPQQQALFV